MCSGTCESHDVNVSGHRIATDSSVTARKITGHCRRIPRAAMSICDSVHRNQARGICHYKIAVPKLRRAWRILGLNLAKLFLHDQKIRVCALESKCVASVASSAPANAHSAFVADLVTVRDPAWTIALLALWYLKHGPPCTENMSSWMTALLSRASYNH